MLLLISRSISFASIGMGRSKSGSVARHVTRQPTLETRTATGDQNGTVAWQRQCAPAGGAEAAGLDTGRRESAHHLIDLARRGCHNVTGLIRAEPEAVCRHVGRRLGEP